MDFASILSLDDGPSILSETLSNYRFLSEPHSLTKLYSWGYRKLIVNLPLFFFQGLLAEVKGFLHMFYAVGSLRFFWITLTRWILPQLWLALRYRSTPEERALDFVKKTATEGDPASVLDALDEYYAKHEVMISLMPEKSGCPSLVITIPALLLMTSIILERTTVLEYRYRTVPFKHSSPCLTLRRLFNSRF